MDEMGREYSAHCCWLENLKGRDYSKDADMSSYSWKVH